jgi:Fe-S-cluster-containing dehydrogenase component
MISRQDFLRLSGLSFLTLAGRKTLRALTETTGLRKTRWGLAVDVRRCAQVKGCTLCIQACNRAHNVPVIADPRHEVRWIWKDPVDRVFRDQELQYSSVGNLPAMVLCNHCDNPPCVRVCPTQATWKREDGIVAMDWHRCIGCRYCMAACPYGSRSFNWVDPRPYIANQTPDYPTRTKGVVEKCTLCVERISVGRPPACVEVCPVKALVFGNLADPASEIRRVLGSRYHVSRRPELGTRPDVFYIL